MKGIFVFLLIAFMFNEGFSQHFLSSYDRTLDSLYRVLIKDPECEKKQQDFFASFPDNFEKFCKTYSYDSKYSRNPMYQVGEEHVFKGLARLDKISDTTFYSRLINLSVGGKWDADAVSALQDLIQKKTEKNPDLTFYLLSRLAGGEYILFGIFILILYIR